MNITTGQRLRITTLVTHIVIDDDALDVVTEQARRQGRNDFAVPKKELPIGATYEGIVTDAGPDGFFDLTMADGTALGFYAPDGLIKIEVLDTPDVPTE